jgi:hypothetical protein
MMRSRGRSRGIESGTGRISMVILGIGFIIRIPEYI